MARGPQEARTSRPARRVRSRPSRAWWRAPATQRGSSPSTSDPCPSGNRDDAFCLVRGVEARPHLGAAGLDHRVAGTGDGATSAHLAVQTTPSIRPALGPSYAGQTQHRSMSTMPCRGQTTCPASTARIRSSLRPFALRCSFICRRASCLQASPGGAHTRMSRTSPIPSPAGTCARKGVVAPAEEGPHGTGAAPVGRWRVNLTTIQRRCGHDSGEHRRATVDPDVRRA
jgi:hypothetical protein